jgi:hypothetical protein
MDTILDSLRLNWKRYLASSLLTFTAGFLVVFVANIDSLTIDSLSNGTIVGLLFMGLRAGMKVAMEYVLSLIIIKK